MAMNPNREAPDEFEALLPWSATGRLSAEDRARTEKALEERDDLRLQMRLIEEDRDATIALCEDLGAPSTAVWDRIAAVAAAEPRRQSWLARFAGAFAASSPPLRFAGAAAALVIVLESTAIVRMLPATTASAGFGTASVTTEAVSGAFALVAFTPETRLDVIDAWLGETHGTIVDGPHGGFYKIRFGDKTPDAAALDALIGRIRANPFVKLALPAKG
jgi:anti-sigma factor RsiW